MATMNDLELSDYKIGQLVGVILRTKVDGQYHFHFKQARISKLVTTSKGTTIYTTPKLFYENYKVEDYEYKDYRTIPENDVLMVNTPMLITKDMGERFEKIVDRWNSNPPKGIFD